MGGDSSKHSSSASTAERAEVPPSRLLKSTPVKTPTFHHVHSDNVGLSEGDKRASRLESFCKGICFTNYKYGVGDVVMIRVSTVSTTWSGFLRVGFTSVNPSSLTSDSLPKYACPDLTSQPGYWAKALPETYCRLNNLISYHFDRNGDVYVSLNQAEPYLFISGVNPREKLWALVDIYGNATSIDILDSRQAARPRSLSSPTLMAPGPSNLILQDVMEESTTLSMISDNSPPIHYTQYRYSQFPFHHRFGCNASLSSDRLVAHRAPAEYSRAYVFSNRPIRVNEVIVIKVLGMDDVFTGGLTFGMTACDPGTISRTELPEDADTLLDRPEYWIVFKDVVQTCNLGDEFSFHLQQQGELYFGKNNSSSTVLVHVDVTTPMWVFFDLYGKFSRLKSLGISYVNPTPSQPTTARSPPARPPLHRSSTTPASGSGMSASGSGTSASGSGTSASGSGTSASPSRMSASPFRMSPFITSGRSASATATGRSSSTSGASSLTVDVNMMSSGPPLPPRPSPGKVPHSASLPASPTDPSEQNECAICFDKPCNSVVYTCGHACMCFECATDLMSRSEPTCPVCRKEIKDIIKVYKS